MNMNFYNALSIEERTHVKSPVDNTAPIPEAYLYWERLTSSNLTKLLTKIFSVDINFIKQHYSSKYEEFVIKNDWRQELKNINFSKNYNLENDEHIKDAIFFPFFKPFLNYYRNNLTKSLSEQIKAIITSDCFKSLEKQLLQFLLSIAKKTLILEINEKKDTNALKGNDPSERYQHFCNMLNENTCYKVSLMKEYPVLFRLLTKKTTFYIDNVKLIINKFLKDKNAIIQNFKIKENDLQNITNISMGDGDTHNNMSVSILTFNNQKKLVFKPRNLKIDERFNDFINWINSIKDENTLKIKTPKVINNNFYGWSEYIDFQDSKNLKNVREFYTSLGQQLAILYLLNTTDMHFENIIANVNSPILVDLETLFHHTIIENSIPLTPSLKKAANILHNSVLSTGILPITTKGFDLSGSGNTDNTNIPFKMEELRNIYTDNINISKEKNTLLKPGKNHPTVNNDRVKTSDYINEIINGFENMYNLFLNHKIEISNKLKIFKNVPIRKIFRNTQQYSFLINLSYHPDFLRNQIDRDFLFSRLYKESVDNKELISLIPFEIKQLNSGNFPYFETLTNSNDLNVGNDEKIKNFFQVNGYKECLKQLKSLSLDDLYQQKKIIEGSLLGIESSKDININKLNNESHTFLEKAEDIANLLLDTAVKDHNELCWISMAIMGEDEANMAFSITGHGLYDGNAGICMFFTYLWKLTKKEKYKKAAYASLTPLKLSLINIIKDKDFSIGPFMGLTGYIYVCHHMAHIFSDKTLLQESIHYAEQLDKFILNDRLIDIIGGGSGALIVIINLYNSTQKPSLLKIIESLVTHILNNAFIYDDKVYWPTVTNNEGYTGFSHGTSGIISALSYYYRSINHDNKIYNIIKMGLKTENINYNKSHYNWYSKHINGYNDSWCHGSAGIFLSRAIINQNISPSIDYVVEDLNNAFNSLLLRNKTFNYSLCHGEIGIIDIMLFIKEINPKFKKHDLSEEIDKSIYGLYRHLNQIKGDLNMIGLMGGITGIAYGLLRIINPKEVPSILSLQNIK
ncbi:type 2 lantipeptide synthetase LanM [Staphylococcus caprae]|uniref:type 2 lanthipeptide synthetase LanM family protein n=1 Tax=Staphylococcus caprae TaxID=29380 RepID=UPI001C82C6D8|nr:type 2 lanthipeptide synthetase LanM family protein [Staphylococcus caprae]MBX5320273.1 type 2 lantipeptide synthetase LanM [Staphylococcus caprae]